MKTSRATPPQDAPERLSRLRQQLRTLRQRQESLIWQLADSSPMVMGCFYTVMKTCSQPNCRCHRGEKHGPFPALSWSMKGKRKMVMVRAEDAPIVKAKVETYKLFVRGVRELVRLNGEVARILDEIGTLLREEYP